MYQFFLHLRQSADMVPKPGAASVPKANSLNSLDQEKTFR